MRDRRGRRGIRPDLARAARDVAVEVGEAVAGAVDRVQQRLLERLVDHLAQVVEVAAQRVGVRQQVAPDLALDVAAADHARRFAHQDRQQLEPDRRDLQLLAAALHAQRRGVEHEVADAQHFGADLAAVAADQCAHARLELADLERLDEVVVGAGVEPESLSSSVSRAVSISTGVDFFASLRSLRHSSSPSMPRQHQVEHDDVVAVLGREPQARGPSEA